MKIIKVKHNKRSTRTRTKKKKKNNEIKSVIILKVNGLNKPK